MPIVIINWIMIIGLISTYIGLNIPDKTQTEIPDRRLEKDRRHFSYSLHIPERRTAAERRSSQK